MASKSDEFFGGYGDGFKDGYKHGFQDGLNEARAKLAKTVEGLQHYACSCVIPCEQLNGSCGDAARKALAELTGGSDE